MGFGSDPSGTPEGGLMNVVWTILGALLVGVWFLLVFIWIVGFLFLLTAGIFPAIM